jgi:hypothetical protein
MQSNWQFGTESNLEMMVNRLDRLEKQNRIFKWGAAAIAAGAALTVLLAAGESDSVVKARRLELTDSSGAVRCQLGVEDDGSVSQTFTDAQGAKRIHLFVDAQGVARLRLLDDAGNTRVSGAAFSSADKNKDAAGLASLWVNATGHKEDDTNSNLGGVGLTATAAGEVEQGFYDHEGKLRIDMISTQRNNENAAIALLGKGDSCNSSLTLGEFNNGVPYETFYDNSGVRRISDEVEPNGDAVRSMFDSSCMRLAQAVTSGGNALENICDSNGKSRFLTGSFADGAVGQSYMGSDGMTKTSTFVKPDDSVAYYIEKSAAEQAWDTYKDVRDVIQVFQDIKSVHDAVSDNKK